MMLVENIRLALSALMANKMRALLTMLGIIIGIGSVITIMTVGNSLTNSVSESMKSMGANNVMVGVRNKTADDNDSEKGLNYGSASQDISEMQDSDKITSGMIEAYRTEYQGMVENIELTESIGNGTVKNGGDYANVNISGVNNSYFTVEDIKADSGRLLNAEDQRNAKKTAVVSDKLVDNMFDGNSEAALGSNIDVYCNEVYESYTIVGIYTYEDTGFGFMSTSDYDTSTDLYIPLQTAMNINHVSDGYSQLTVVTSAGIDSEQFAKTTESYFNRYYKDNRNFSVTAYSMASIAETMTDMLGTISFAISIVAGISLLVGGIGVMNIMLVSITERTREIGTRKAIGATNNSIRIQFIMEAIVICLIGGIIGICMGIALGIFAANLLGYPASPSITSILISVTFSLIIGIFFGYHPANKAAKLNPIDALRYE